MRALLAIVSALAVVVACSETSSDPFAAGGGGPNYAEEASPILVCPGPFTPVKLLQQTDGMFDEADHNRDNQVCRLDVVDHNDGTLIHRTFVDNNVALKVGTCPRNFENIAARAGEGADLNGDGRACQATLPNGAAVIVDNRFDA
jgi:hypothetical protein